MANRGRNSECGHNYLAEFRQYPSPKTIKAAMSYRAFMGKATASTLMALLFMGAFMLASNPSVDKSALVHAQAGTSVGGMISGDTTWTPNDSPYNFASSVTVDANCTLTILPGTTVNIEDSSFIIDGTLQAVGNESDRITFEGQPNNNYSWPPRILFNDSSTAYDQETGAGCIISYAEIDIPNWQYETIIGPDPMISNNIIYNAGNDAAAIRTDGLVVNNTVMGGFEGITVAYPDMTIENNLVEDATFGICCGYFSTEPIFHPIILGNTLTSNYCGIEDYECAPYIANNTIDNNGFGFYFSSYTFDAGAAPGLITNNNIYNNHYNVLVGFTDNQTVNMADNWWGAADSSTIAKTIYDNTTDPSTTKINYSPFLTQPNQPATSTSPTSSPTQNFNSIPTPTSPTTTPNSTPLNNISAANNFLEAKITEFAEIAVVTLAAGWTVVLVVFARRRSRKAVH